MSLLFVFALSSPCSRSHDTICLARYRVRSHRHDTPAKSTTSAPNQPISLDFVSYARSREGGPGPMRGKFFWKLLRSAQTCSDVLMPAHQNACLGKTDHHRWNFFRPSPQPLPVLRSCPAALWSPATTPCHAKPLAEIRPPSLFPVSRCSLLASHHKKIRQTNSTAPLFTTPRSKNKPKQTQFFGFRGARRPRQGRSHTRGPSRRWSGWRSDQSGASWRSTRELRYNKVFSRPWEDAIMLLMVFRTSRRLIWPASLFPSSTGKRR